MRCINVLLEAIRSGISRADAPFGYATLASPEGTYRGLVYQQPVSSVLVDDNSVLVRMEAADAQLEAERLKREATASAGSVAVTIPSSFGNPSATRGKTQEDETPGPARPRLTTRYHGTVSLDSQRVNREMGTIVEEIIQRLTSLTGTEVEIIVEISAERTTGFDDSTIRTISENSRTLKFKNHGFEGE
ncbi:MAG: hypothetical protein ABI947_03440 [Chloroflexota bacterium]